MRRMILLFALLLLPACGMAVPEGVVEAAPQVDVGFSGMTDALFGAWEEGLSEIRAGAARAAMAWKPGIGELALEKISLYNSPMDEHADNDKLTVYFRGCPCSMRAARAR